MIRRLFGTTALATALLLAQPARAEPTEAAQAAADDLFQQARKLFAEKRFGEACPLFAESLRLAERGGTLQNLAVCYEEQGKLASAYGRFQDLRTLSRKPEALRPDRVTLAEDHLARLTPRLTRVRLRLSAPVGGVRLRIEKDEFEQASWSSGVLIDPGDHTLVVIAPGKKPFTKKLQVPATPGFVDVDVPAFEDVPSPPLAARPTPGELEHPFRTTGFVVGGVGIAALAAGAVFGILTITKNDDARQTCQRSECTLGSSALDDSHRQTDAALLFGTLSSVLVPLGAVGLGVGAYLVVHSSPTRTTARLRPTPGGALLEGEF